MLTNVSFRSKSFDRGSMFIPSHWKKSTCCLQPGCTTYLNEVSNLQPLWTIYKIIYIYRENIEIYIYIYMVAYPYIQYMYRKSCLHRRMAYGNTMEIRTPSTALGRAKVRVAANLFWLMTAMVARHFCLQSSMPGTGWGQNVGTAAFLDASRLPCATAGLKQLGPHGPLGSKESAH